MDQKVQPKGPNEYQNQSGNKRRRSLPREGVRKLKVSLDNEFTKANLKVGRDTLFNVLRKHQMLTLKRNTVVEPLTHTIAFISITTL